MGENELDGVGGGGGGLDWYICVEVAVLKLFF